MPYINIKITREGATQEQKAVSHAVQIGNAASPGGYGNSSAPLST
jgi:hypothetical protein